MATREEIEAQVRAEHPAIREHRNGLTVTLGLAEYEATVAAWAAAEAARQAAEAEATTERQRLALVREAITALDAGTATNRQAQAVLAILAKRALREWLGESEG